MFMNLKCHSLCDIGLVRQDNQDSIYTNEDLGLFIVADGMGGHEGGQVASQMAIEAISEYIKKNLNQISSPVELLEKAIKKANTDIYETGCYENPELMGMGTTVVSTFFLGQKVYIANVGDSRTYLFQKPRLWQLTDDHSLLFEQVRNGIISEKQSQLITGKSILTRSVGTESFIDVDTFIFSVPIGGLLMLCSDGLCGLTTNLEIMKAMDSAENSQQMIPLLFNLAKENGGHDNISILIIEI